MARAVVTGDMALEAEAIRVGADQEAGAKAADEHPPRA